MRFNSVEHFVKYYNIEDIHHEPPMKEFDTVGLYVLETLGSVRVEIEYGFANDISQFTLYVYDEDKHVWDTQLGESKGVCGALNEISKLIELPTN